MLEIIKTFFEKILGSFIDFKKEKELEKIKNPKKYGLLELEKILHDFNQHEHILDKAKDWDWRKIQIKWGKTLYIKELNEGTLNNLLAQITAFEPKLKKWHKEYYILNKCSKDLENAYWDVYNFFEKDRTELNQEDIIKFFLRRKKLLKEIWKELNR